MRPSTFSLLFASLILLSTASTAQPIPADSLYLGQTPPGTTPVVFRLPFTSGLRPVERIAISSDGTEIYFGELNTYPPNVQNALSLRYSDGRWQGPTPLFNGVAAPRLSANDSVMYVESNIAGFATTYVSRRTVQGWSAPVRLFDTDLQSHYFQTAGSGNGYLSSDPPSSPATRDICRLVISGTDTLISPLGAPINTPADENDLYVAGDESYLLFSRNLSPGGDIYLSFRTADGRWTNPKRLPPPINKSGASWEYGQFVTKDGKYLFYTSGGTTMSTYNTYWVRIDGIIDSLRHTNFIPYVRTAVPALATGGGSFSYTVPESTFTDDDGNGTLSYSASLNGGEPLPAWLSFDPALRRFSGTPPQSVTLTLLLTATDPAGAKAACTFTLTAVVAGANERRHPAPERMQLHQNHPNPFNPVTTIGFSIPEKTDVTLSVHDVLGRELATLLRAERPAGTYTVQWNGAGNSGGTYFARLQAGRQTQIVRMALLK